MFRDDHDAALARVTALEAELARERQDDAEREHKVKVLAAQLAEARVQLARTEAELAKLRPPAPEPRPPLDANIAGPSARATPRTGVIGRGTIVFVAVLGLAVAPVVGSLVCGVRSSQRTSEAAPVVNPAFVPDEVHALLPEIERRGQAQLPGARLLELDGEGITADGSLHPTYGKLTAMFQRDETRVAPVVDPDVPIGAAPPVIPSSLDEHKCTYVLWTASGWEQHALASLQFCAFGDLSKHHAALAPRCSMSSIWALAIRDGAPRDAIAKISLRSSSWRFQIEDQRFAFEKSYPDSCDRSPATD